MDCPKSVIIESKTYHNHRSKSLNLQPSSLDSGFLYDCDELVDNCGVCRVSPSFICAKTGKITYIADAHFIEKKTGHSCKHDSKSAVFLSHISSITFNGATIFRLRNNYKIKQFIHIR